MSQKNKTALIIDDDSDIIDLVSIYLEDEFNIFSATHASKALEHVDQQKFDIIIVDIYLPEIDGRKIIREIRLRNHHTPILAISGYLQRDAFLPEVQEIGANDFIEKPFLLGTFLNTVSRLSP